MNESDRDDTTGLEALERIDSVCLDFEKALRAGDSPKIEDMLALAPDGGRNQLLRELLLLELAQRFENRELDPTEYHERFPAYRQLVDAVCEQLKQYRQQALASMPTAVERVEPERVGAIVGRYKLLQTIGEGGMGTVYMAEQQEPVRRRVALKIIKPGMDSREVVARFEAERQALALMEHQNIAKVLDAGTTENGRPFFVMELVRGVPITKYCDDNRLSITERLGLFETVCQAIQHAHQKGIIHRDIKPSNVLVCNFDGKPVPKVIDFGIAKAIQQSLTEKTLFTRYGQMVGTPAYMSPEQAEMNQLDVDTRSDVYSLGVLLYELLTGDTPITGEQLRAAGWDGMIRLIREQEPPKPSTRLSTSGATLSSISAQRRTEPKTLGSLVRGDLDLIVMKALEKDRTRRYASANDLARDVERHLADEPVEARPPSIVYKVHKLFRKNRVGIVVASIFASLLVSVVLAGLGITHLVARDRQRIQNENSQKIASQKLQSDGKRARALVDVLLTADAPGVPDAIAALKPLRNHALPLLRSKYDAKAIEPTQRLHVACALAEFEDVRLRVLADGILHAPSGEIANIVAALRHARDDSAKHLNSLFQEVQEPATRVRLAIVLLHLGDTKASQAMSALGPDPTARTMFIHGLHQWHADLSDYSQPLRDSKDTDFCSSLCLAIGRIPVDEVSAKEKQTLERAMLQLYHDAPGGSTHSACDWALRQWKIALPKFDGRSEFPTDQQWYVNPEGMAFVRIPAGSFVRADINGKKQTVTLTREFWLADREVAVSQVQSFVDDCKAKERPNALPRMHRTYSPTGEHPANSVSWHDAILYCNWLSVRHRLQPYYEDSGLRRTLDPEPNGYRLPTEAEWEYACRAMSTTNYFFGDDESRLNEYAAFRGQGVTRDLISLPCASKMPNGWGLFDMHGNVSEHCADWFETWIWSDEDASQVAIDPQGTDFPRLPANRVSRGGSYGNFSSEAKSANRNSSPPTARWRSRGFRVARN